MQIEMLSSTLIKREKRRLIPVIVIIVGFTIVYQFIFSTSLKRKVVASRRESCYPDKMFTARDASYMLFGDGELDTDAEKQLHKYILAMTSTQTPGEPRVAGSAEKRHYSQIGQSQYVDKLLKGRRNGVFLECGASDGVHLSNSLFFEIHRNWTGILIEASPLRLKSLIKRNRNAFVVRSCLSITRKPEIMLFAKPENVAGGLSSSLPSSTIKRFMRRSKTNDLSETYVQCFPLISILDALDIHHIDYFSLDVEGAEIGILKTVDWTKLTVDVFTIEYNGSLNKLRQLRAIFNETGLYREVRLLPGGSERSGQDVVFVHL